MLVFLFAFHFANGQTHYHHEVFWLRVVVADTFSQKFKWEVYYQRRTQNNYKGDPNIFHSPQFKSYWLWFYYNLNKNVKLSVSPFGYFETYTLNTKLSDPNIPPVKEFRWSARLEHETKGRYFNYSNRYGLEYRWRDLKNNGVYQPNFRARYMVRLDKPVKGIFSGTKPVTFTISDEIFLQFGPAVKKNPNVFDQNRLYAGAAYEIFRNVKLSLGYIYWLQARNSGVEFDNINTYWTIITFDNVLSQFKRK